MDIDERNLVSYDEEPDQGGGFTARDALYILFRHKWKMACFFILVMTVGTLAVLMIPKSYLSEGQIMLNMGRSGVAGFSDSTVSGTELPRSLRSEITIMQGRKIAESVVESIGAERILRKPELTSPIEKRLKTFREKAGDTLKRIRGKKEPNPEAMEAYLREYAIKRVMGSLELKERDNLILANCYAPDDELAQSILQNVMEAYELRHIEVWKPTMVPEHFKSMADETKAKLVEKDEELRAYREKHDIVSMQDQKTAIISSIEERRSSKHDLLSQVSASKAIILEHEQTL